jgi:hypothetical protein
MDIVASLKAFVGGINAGPFREAFANPLYVAVLITLCVMLIILVVWKEGRMVKTTFYVFMAVAGLVFLHNNLLLIEHDGAMDSRRTIDLLNTTGGYFEPSIADTLTHIQSPYVVDGHS